MSYISGAGLAPTTRNSVCISALLILIYFVLAALLTSPRSYGDDLDVIRSVFQARSASSAEAAWAHLFSPHNEHRIVVTRLVFWLAYALADPPDFRVLALVGDLFLLGVFAVFARAARDIDAPPSSLIVLAGLIFNFGSADSMIWAMAALSNYGVLFFALFTFYLLSRPDAWRWAPAPAILAVLSQANGLLVLLLGAAYLACNRRWVSATVWAVFTALAFRIYLPGIDSPAAGAGILRQIQRLPELLLYALSFCGSAFGYGGEGRAFLNSIFLPITALVGMGLCALTFWSLMRPAGALARPFVWFNLFVIATAALTAVSRIDFGLSQALAPRYHVNSCALIASTLLMLLSGSNAYERIGDLLRRYMPHMAGAAILYVVATLPVLWYIVTVVHPQASAQSPP